jgi:general secretion pathway protein G
LVEKRYIRALPVDPFTKLADTWTLVASEDPDHAGIRDVHSGAPDIASDGSPVALW